MVERLPELSGSLLDLGCGYGCIGIMLAKIYDLKLTMTDVNQNAVIYAAKNASLNGVKSETFYSDGFLNIAGAFDSIAVNPPIHAGKGVTYRMYGESKNHLNPNGSLYIVIQKKHGAESAHGELAKIFGGSNVETIYKKKGYHIYGCVNLPGDEI